MNASTYVFVREFASIRSNITRILRLPYGFPYVSDILPSQSMTKSYQIHVMRKSVEFVACEIRSKRIKRILELVVICKTVYEFFNRMLLKDVFDFVTKIIPDIQKSTWLFFQ